MNEATNAYPGYSAERFMQDLDRCEHGRHPQDDCYGCPNGNLGNPLMRGVERHLDTGELVLGYTVGGSFMYVLVSPDDHVPGTFPVRMIRA